ncbi:alpha/beta hydrolase [Paenibacillus sp. LHD-38]|uniref:alpha/beta hydrolase n=1 Tax=Paenibacillus sp. LHD-38 TaxID=3072143 RepID=UPI00280E36CC|nr:alpha/beta hydrolase [Paenibacillus sp. LHD-38]MDQ8732977.1 alpha/beta hydrolase [Paenibacillus sp. LHD-38]
MLREEWQITGAKGTVLFLREWKPETAAVKAAVCLVHGMGEHGDRYAHVAARFTEAGIAVIALDQQGHGRSSGKRGHLYSLGAAVSDAALMIEAAASRHPGAPIFLYGHSMGGNVALNCALRLHPEVQGLILTSPWLRLAFKPNPAVEWFGRRLASIMPALQQSTGLNPADLFRPGYEMAAPIAEDPLCHTKITLQAFKEITSGGEWALANAGNLQIPLLLMHGTSDRVTSLEASQLLAEKLGGKCHFRRWDGGYHELHNDIEGEKAIQEIIKWLEEQL